MVVFTDETETVLTIIAEAIIPAPMNPTVKLLTTLIIYCGYYLLVTWRHVPRICLFVFSFLSDERGGGASIEFFNSSALRLPLCGVFGYEI